MFGLHRSTVSMVSWLLGSTILKYRFDDLKQWRTVPLLFSRLLTGWTG